MLVSGAEWGFLQALHREAQGGGLGHEGLVLGLRHPRLPGQDPQVLPVRRAHQHPPVVGVEIQDQVVAEEGPEEPCQTARGGRAGPGQPVSPHAPLPGLPGGTELLAAHHRDAGSLSALPHRVVRRAEPDPAPATGPAHPGALPAAPVLLPED